MAVRYLPTLAVLALWLSEPAWAEGPFRPDLDAICRAGEQMAEGCEAIRRREGVDASLPPWSAIGRVNFASTQVRSHCTGTLVADRVVLTAAHCLFNHPRKRWIPPQSLSFAAGYQRGAAVAVSEVERFVLPPDIDTNGRKFEVPITSDWALLVLKDPIGRQAGILATADPMPGKTEPKAFLMAGYAGLRPHVLSVERNCGSPVTREALMMQRCAAMSGDSGAPLLVRINGEMKVIGVLSSVAANDPPISLGVPVSQLSRALIRATAD